MESNVSDVMQIAQPVFLNPQTVLAHWLGHRKLTRRVIESFPEDKLFSFSVGGMRSFADLAMEIVRMGAPGIRGMVTRQWQTWQDLEKSYPMPENKNDLLALWDLSSKQIESLWPHITPQRFNETEKVFGQYEGPVWWSILYFIDNEIHHRAQGYVYLRALGIKPPDFWDR